MNQGDLFTGGPAQSRATDPATSRMAAEAHEARGRAESHRRLCLDDVIARPNHTAAEIARHLGLERHVPSRRLPELRQAGLVKNGAPRMCVVTGTMSMTWLPCPLSPKASGLLSPDPEANIS